MLLRHVRLVPIIDISLGGHSVKTCLALPSDPSYNNLWVGLRAMVQERPVRVERRLSAILAADVAGYSRLMHSDEEPTHAKLTALLTGGVEPAIAEHGGRIVKNTGDGFLAEFPSAVEAVRAAVQFQARIKELTIGEVEERRIAFRVGVNIGDVIVEPHDIFGDGVNIAARLESIAEPGGVCISSAAYDQVQGKVGVEFADLGEQDLKNIARPVRAYAVVRAGSGPVIQSGRARPTPFSPPPLSIAGAGRRSRSSIQVPHRPPLSRSSQTRKCPCLRGTSVVPCVDVARPARSLSSTAVIASGAPWCVAGISAGSDAASENNAPATRAESAQTVLTKTAQATPETDREPAFGERRGVTTSSKFKARKFWRGVMRPLAPVRSGRARGRVGARVPRYTAEIVELFSRQSLRSIP